MNNRASVKLTLLGDISMTTKTRETPWFGPEEMPQLTDLWRCLQDNYDAVMARMEASSMGDPAFAAAVRATPPDLLALQQRDVRKTLDRGFSGQWQLYADGLRASGAMYARSGVALNAWMDRSAAFARELHPHLVHTYGREPERLIRVLQVLNRLANRMLATMADAYFQVKKHELQHSERSRATFAHRNEKLEAESIKEELRESEELYGMLVKNIRQFAILTLDPDGNITSWNEAAEKLKGYTAAEVLGKHFTLFYPPGSAAAGVLERELAVALREGRFEGEGWRVRKDGTQFWANVTITPLYDAAGKHRGFGKVTRDFTERHAVELALMASEDQLRAAAVALERQNKQVLEASRMKSEFLANMSHELRTPLNAIIGFTELIHEGVVKPDSPEFPEFLGDILASSHHLLHLINDVLDLSKIEAGKLEFRPERLDLATVVPEVIGVLLSSATKASIEAGTEIAADLRDLYLDSSRFRQLLYNYLSNAIKFTAPGGRIDVRLLDESATTLRLEVADTGIGIAPADVPRLFTEFQQLDAGYAKRHAGTGLGLALSKRIVEAQGGSVGVRSEVGKGSVFFAILPKRMKASQVSVGNNVPQTTNSAAPRVLVVEDDLQDQARLVKALTAGGYQVATAMTAAQAVAMCQQEVFGAITLDLLLPDSSGVQVLKTIRASSKNREIPVVVVSIVTEEGAVGGFAVHDILSKPVDAAALLASLARAGALPGHGGSVLVVDDDHASLRLMAATLAELGYPATCVADASLALRGVQAHPPIAVVLDLAMPGMDGFEFLEQFRATASCRLIPVIVWTVRDLNSVEMKRLRQSAQRVIQKSRLDHATLVQELRRFLPVPLLPPTAGSQAARLAV
jgi:PAS domain S-box-containing protein